VKKLILYGLAALTFVLFVLFSAAMFLANSYTTFFLVDFFGFIGVSSIIKSVTENPIKPTEFTIKGFYKYCRHPMYLFVIMAYWLAPVMTYSRLEFVTLGSLYFLIGTFYEEKSIRRELGEVYDKYRANVPMWIPRLTPWKPDN
jgi:protein-S-isoprenylcysteine O-methyltransferase Ste14